MTLVRGCDHAYVSREDLERNVAYDIWCNSDEKMHGWMTIFSVEGVLLDEGHLSQQEDGKPLAWISPGDCGYC